jgi:outer membrane pore protein C
MKLKLVAVAVTSMLAAGVVNAAEIYNKDGNKLDLYGKVTGLHYFSDDAGATATKPTFVWASKAKLRSTSCPVTASGNMSSGQQRRRRQPVQNPSGVCRSEIREAVLSTTVVTTVCLRRGAWTDVLPEFGGDTYGADNFMLSRANGVATYRNTDFFGLVDGLNFALQYQGKNGSVSPKTTVTAGVCFQL